MERTVPSTTSEEIGLYLRTIYSLLRSTTDVDVRTLEEVHASIDSALHPDARKTTPDTSAFIYSLLRLPDCMPVVKTIVLGQSSRVFAQYGFEDLENWAPVSAAARRRRCYFNEDSTLACFIASRSDIDDVVPGLVAYQIEWNKLHDLLQRCPKTLLSKAKNDQGKEFQELAKAIKISKKDLRRLQTIWGSEFVKMLSLIRQRRCHMKVRLLSGSLTDYWRATLAWWTHIEQIVPELVDRPVYFISSNPHSVPNLLSGYALQQKEKLIEYIEKTENSALLGEWEQIQSRQVRSSMENFLYYVLKKYQQSDEGAASNQAQLDSEQENGITRINSQHSFEVDSQVVELSKLNPDWIDPRLSDNDWDFLKQSDALILNIDYPLGLAAYNILITMAQHVCTVEGIYLMGKAATLNGVIGDIIIPNIVHDEHSHNTYMLPNIFAATDVTPYLNYGTVLDNQKAVCVLGTFLQNRRVMDVMYREGYTDIEMEAGPFLSAVYEMHRPQRHPINEIVNLYGVPFDVGILHYASDTPMSKGKNLGAGTLSYWGIDSTYAATLAILRRIFHLERQRLGC
jgi:hypothetical protein